MSYPELFSIIFLLLSSVLQQSVSSPSSRSSYLKQIHQGQLDWFGFTSQSKRLRCILPGWVSLQSSLLISNIFGKHGLWFITLHLYSIGLFIRSSHTHTHPVSGVLVYLSHSCRSCPMVTIQTYESVGLQASASNLITWLQQWSKCRSSQLPGMQRHEHAMDDSSCLSNIPVYTELLCL